MGAEPLPTVTVEPFLIVFSIFVCVLRARRGAGRVRAGLANGKGKDPEFPAIYVGS